MKSHSLLQIDRDTVRMEVHFFNSVYSQIVCFTSLHLHFVLLSAQICQDVLNPSNKLQCRNHTHSLHISSLNSKISSADSSLGMTSTSIILSDVSVTVDFSGTSFFPPRHFFLSCHPNIYLFSPEEVPTDQYYLLRKVNC